MIAYVLMSAFAGFLGGVASTVLGYMWLLNRTLEWKDE